MHAAYRTGLAKCGACSSDANRAKWGCDAKAAGVVFRSTCPECLGSDRACPRCRGRGEVDWFRCPTSQAEEDGRMAYQAFKHYQHGFLPHEGGWADQPAVLREVVSLAEMESSKIERELAS